MVRATCIETRHYAMTFGMGSSESNKQPYCIGVDYGNSFFWLAPEDANKIRAYWWNEYQCAAIAKQVFSDGPWRWVKINWHWRGGRIIVPIENGHQKEAKQMQWDFQLPIEGDRTITMTLTLPKKEAARVFNELETAWTGLPDIPERR